MTSPQDILAFWLDEIGPQGWYNGTEELDQKIRDRYLEPWQQACDGKFSLWLTYPSGVLAYIILLDQFPRNMFRDQGRAFASDRIALAASKSAIERRWDLRIDAPARDFFYLPLRHSESLCDQERSVRLVCERMDDAGSLLHARAHREVIRRYGRFPYRNKALGRTSTDLEKAYLEAGGYGHTVRSLQEAAKAA